MNADAAITHQPQRGVFFGWRVVAALFISTFALFGVSIYSFIMLTSPLAALHGWSPAETGSLVSAMWLAAPLSLFAAPLINRFGAWPLLVFGFAVQVAVMVSLVVITEYWQLYLLRIVMGCGKIIIAVTVPVIITRWFARRFATAIAVAWAGGSAGGMVMSPLTEWLISMFGWMATSLIIAAGIVVIVGVITLLVRGPSRPADLGIGHDGDPMGADTERGHPDGESWSIQQTLKSINWLTAGAMFLGIVGLGISAIAIISQEPVLMHAAGIPPSTAAAILGLIAASSLIGAVTIGWLMDRFPAFLSGLLITAFIYTGLVAFYILPSVPSAAIGAFAAFGMGYAIGAGEVLWMNLTKRQFGTPAFATTYGGWYLALQVGYAAGGGLGGWAFEQMSTNGFLLFVALMYLPAALFTLWRPAIRQ